MVTNRMKKLRIFVSLLLVFCMFLSYLPVRAEEDNSEYTGIEAEEVTDESTTEEKKIAMHCHWKWVETIKFTIS